MKNNPAIILVIASLTILGLTAAESPTKPPVAVVTEQSKPCFQCQGTGQSKCAVAGCKTGQVKCPAPCLKPDDGNWVRMNVAGHPPTDLWKQFPKRGGGSTGWNQHHAGEVVKIQNGEPVNIGGCTVCGGTTKIKCSICKGTGLVTCPICDGKKTVPKTWSSFDNPKLKNRPSRFTLKDGRIIVGRKSGVFGSSVTIKTESETVTVQADEIVAEEKPAMQK